MALRSGVGPHFFGRAGLPSRSILSWGIDGCSDKLLVPTVGLKRLMSFGLEKHSAFATSLVARDSCSNFLRRQALPICLSHPQTRACPQARMRGAAVALSPVFGVPVGS